MNAFVRWTCLLVLGAVSSSLSLADEAAPTGDPAILPAGAKLERLWNDGEFTEGVAVSKEGLVYFSDIAIEAKNPGRIMKFDPASGKTTVHVADSGQSNGLFFDSKGRLLAVCGANVGLRALCAKYQIDSHANWNKLLTDLEAKLRTIDKRGHGADEAQWAAEAGTHFRFLKNAKRNDAMHPNKVFDERQANETYSGAKSFMQHLATRLSE